MKGFRKESDNIQTMESWEVRGKKARENMWLGRNQQRHRQRCQEVGSCSENRGSSSQKKEQCDFHLMPNIENTFLHFFYEKKK